MANEITPKPDAGEQAQRRRSVVLANDASREEVARVTKQVFIDTFGGVVFSAQTRFAVNDETGNAAENFMVALKDSMKPRD